MPAIAMLAAGGLELVTIPADPPSRMTEIVLTLGLMFAAASSLMWLSKARFYESQLRRVNEEAAEKRSR